jgi:hypothetical protein
MFATYGVDNSGYVNRTEALSMIGHIGHKLQWVTAEHITEVWAAGSGH